MYVKADSRPPLVPPKGPRSIVGAVRHSAGYKPTLLEIAHKQSASIGVKTSELMDIALK